MSGPAMEKQRLMPPDLQWHWSMSVPTSQGWRIDDPGSVIFTGAQFSIDANGKTLGRGDIEVQTQNVFTNLTRVLRDAGADWSNVVKMNTFYVFDGPEQEATGFWEKMTRVRVRFYANPAHCGTGVRVSGLPGDGLLISAAAIAVLPPQG
jgi:2-iminobutanoate/2-iminopropanoate deaminase